MTREGKTQYSVFGRKQKDAVLHLIGRNIASFKDAGTHPLLILLSYRWSHDSMLACAIGWWC
jgi:hypothetical protein